MPAKEDNGVPPKAEDSLFLLLVRGPRDQSPLSEKCQGSDNTAEVEGYPLSVDQTVAQASGSDCEVEDTDAHGGSPFLPLRISSLT
jgi:hypothetical protein